MQLNDGSLFPIHPAITQDGGAPRAGQENKKGAGVAFCRENDMARQSGARSPYITFTPLFYQTAFLQ
jgi:hypothetical protein